MISICLILIRLGPWANWWATLFVCRGIYLMSGFPTLVASLRISWITISKYTSGFICPLIDSTKDKLSDSTQLIEILYCVIIWSAYLIASPSRSVVLPSALISSLSASWIFPSWSRTTKPTLTLPLSFTATSQLCFSFPLADFDHLFSIVGCIGSSFSFSHEDVYSLKLLWVRWRTNIRLIFLFSKFKYLFMYCFNFFCLGALIKSY